MEAVGSEGEAGSVGAGERSRRRSAAAGGGELGQSPEAGNEEKASALATGQARRWRNSGSHCSIVGGMVSGGGTARERGGSRVLFETKKIVFVFSQV